MGFVKLGHPDQRQEVGLIDRERFLKRMTFAFHIGERALRQRQIHPVRPVTGLAPAGNIEMHRRRRRIRPRQSVGPQPVARGGLRIVNPQHRFEMTPRLVAQPGTVRALRLSQMLLDAVDRHDRVEPRHVKPVKRRG